MFLMIPVHLKVTLTIIITVDRSNILKTTFAEFKSIGDFCKTFEVDFMGERKVFCQWIKRVSCR